jgi:integrase
MIDISTVQMPEIAILLETGLRLGELLGLMWSDFDEENNTISVKRTIADIPGGVKTNPP